MPKIRALPAALTAMFLLFTLFARNGLAAPPAEGPLPGDAMIRRFLTEDARKMDAAFADDLALGLTGWNAKREQWMTEFRDMLGLEPMPEKTPLRATVTGTVERGDVVIEKLHYQSSPGLYVTANLYRPKEKSAAGSLPGILYVCGHSDRGACGNKTQYQAHGLWFARNGYVCLMVDTLQLGEIRGIHHGTYREGRFWWQSRGYSPAGVECWNGIRGLDYLQSRPEVDPKRLGVTGISGGGASTFWIAAADPRATVCVPVSGMADLASYVGDQVVNGHCDCMFLTNTYRWPWTRIAALIAPRPMLFANSDADPIFPMDANARVSDRLERAYGLFGASDKFDTMVSIGDHNYRADLRRGISEFFQIRMRHNAHPVTDSEKDIVMGPRDRQTYPVDPEQLRVFPAGTPYPKDAINAKVDETFVPVAQVAVPEPQSFIAWRDRLGNQLRQRVFRVFPDRIPPARIVRIETTSEKNTWTLETEPGVFVTLSIPAAQPPDAQGLVILTVNADDTPEQIVKDQRTLQTEFAAKKIVAVLQPRGVGASRWTRSNPPNTVERSHALLGRTVDTGRVRDIIAAARVIRDQPEVFLPKLDKKPSNNPMDNASVAVAGFRAAGVLSAYAGFWEPNIDEIFAVNPPVTHNDPQSPVFLNILRVCDIPHIFGMIVPARLVFRSNNDKFTELVNRIRHCHP